jgi:hypothetical protein
MKVRLSLLGFGLQLTITERELKLIAPKGRPVKQCDHCRGARKSKSNHTKCDCVTKRERKEHSPVTGAFSPEP